MPTIPKKVKQLKTTDMQKVVNTIRSNASPYYKTNVPLATNEESIRKIGEIFKAYDSIAQEFMTSLWGRIAKTIISSKLFTNPLAFFKKGEVALGEVIEEGFINPAKPIIYDDDSIPDEAVLRDWGSEIYSAFHVLNYQITYPITIRNDNLSNYFVSWDGVESLIAKMTESLYTAAYYDEFIVMKYMVAKMLLAGEIKTVDVGDFLNNPKQAVTKIRGLSSNMTFLNSKYNKAGVKTYTNRNEQFFLITSEFDALESVEVLADAFNMGKAEFLGHQVLIDGFGELDNERLRELFKYDPNYEELTQTQLDKLNSIAGVIVDRDFYQIYDKLNKFTENYNGLKLFWNYFLHVWRIMSVSPFANAVALVNGEPAVTGITVSPQAVTLNPGQGVQLTVDVTGDNFASNSVTYKTSSENVTVNNAGYVFVKQNATAEEVTITVTSVHTPSVSATATITIQN